MLILVANLLTLQNAHPISSQQHCCWYTFPCTPAHSVANRARLQCCSFVTHHFLAHQPITQWPERNPIDAHFLYIISLRISLQRSRQSATSMLLICIIYPCAPTRSAANTMQLYPCSLVMHVLAHQLKVQRTQRISIAAHLYNIISLCISWQRGEHSATALLLICNTTIPCASVDSTANKAHSQCFSFVAHNFLAHQLTAQQTQRNYNPAYL